MWDLAGSGEMEVKPQVVAEINLKTCKKIDGKVTKVVDKASHVVMWANPALTCPATLFIRCFPC